MPALLIRKGRVLTSDFMSDTPPVLVGRTRIWSAKVVGPHHLDLEYLAAADHVTLFVHGGGSHLSIPLVRLTGSGWSSDCEGIYPTKAQGFLDELVPVFNKALRETKLGPKNKPGKYLQYLKRRLTNAIYKLADKGELCFHLANRKGAHAQ